MLTRRILTSAVGALALGLGLNACAATAPTPHSSHTASAPITSAPSTSDEDASFNDQDVMFAQMMIPHHAQAVEMAEMVLAKDAVDPQVTELAGKIRDAQEPEIDLMTSWLESWGQSTDAPGHGGHGMNGMMSEEDMRALEGATGDEGARLFVDQMIAHHLGAVEMAEAEIEHGQNPDATELAQKIVKDQRAEIDLMNSMLNTL